MLKFSIGFNGSLGFGDVIEKYKDHISEISFPVPALVSGRASGGRFGAHCYTLALHQMLLRAKDLRIPTNVRFDVLCVGSDYGSNRQGEKILSSLRVDMELYSISAVTVVSPIDAQLVKRQLPSLVVHAAVNMFIRNAVQAREVAPFCDVLTLDRNVNRDPDAIAAIRKESGKRIRLLANEGCVLECASRIQHLNNMSHQQSWGVPYYLPCVPRFDTDKATLLKAPIIRPEEIGHYEELVDSIELMTRLVSDQRLDTILGAYTGRRHAGNLFDLIESPALDGYVLTHRQRSGQVPYIDNSAIPGDFWDHVTQCDRLCRDCGYCAQVAEKTFRMVPA